MEIKESSSLDSPDLKSCSNHHLISFDYFHSLSAYCSCWKHNGEGGNIYLTCSAFFYALLIGLGNIGMIYDKSQDKDGTIQSHAKAINLHPKFNLVGGIDIKEKSRRSNGYRFFNKKNYR